MQMPASTNHPSSRDATWWLPVAGGVLGGLGVLIGAGVAHGLGDWLAEQGMAAELIPRRLAQADTAVRYHLIHSVLLLVLFALRDSLGRRGVFWAGLLMVAGIVLFSGSLYLLVLLDQPRFGAVTPFGGMSWIVAWIVIAVAGFRARSDVASATGR
ncbi:DUF423 domain-containing protein [Candidatus Laterigemmans baculatus]|uniref:DUF423 domain-containing protein n=1 Tax=Candidatus Laterigemmans baculatus TaxID=2770505 RepID=UPI001F1D098F|nr:DUF423 domain-containing protein [Candidatus Laterigemmans baculatus]